MIVKNCQKNSIEKVFFNFFVSLVNVHYDFKSEKWLDGETQEERFWQTSTNPGPNTGHRILMT